MKKNSTGIRFICMALTVYPALVGMAFAAECLERSPTFARGRSFSDAILLRELSDTEYGQVKTLLDSMEGRFDGKAREVICNLADIEDQTIDHHTIKADAKLRRSGLFSLDMEFYSAKKRSRHQKTLRLYLKDKFLRIHHDNGTGDVELVGISEHSIELRHRIRVQHRGNRVGIIQEHFYQLSADPAGFSIKHEIYIHGRLKVHDDWRFQRR